MSIPNRIYIREAPGGGTISQLTSDSGAVEFLRADASSGRVLLLALKDAIAFIEARCDASNGGILECGGFKFDYDDALGLVNQIERGC